MCIKVVHDDAFYSKTTQRIKDGAVIPDAAVRDYLTNYEGFTYVCHVFDSWIRCAAWNNNHCARDDVPFEQRSMFFTRPCHSCSGYAHCLSERQDALVSSTTLHVPDGLDPEVVVDAWKRKTATRALERVLLTCSVNYNWLTPEPFEPHCPRRWKPFDDPSDEAILPYLHHWMCIEDPDHMQPWINLSGAAEEGFLYCGCPSLEFTDVLNPLRALDRHAALHISERFEGFDAAVGRIWEAKWFHRNKLRHSKIARDYEFYGYSSDDRRSVIKTRCELQDALDATLERIKPNSWDFFSDETHAGCHSVVHGIGPGTGPSAYPVYERRDTFARQMLWLLMRDPGLPTSAYDSLMHLLHLMLMPWCNGETGIESLDAAWAWAQNEDITSIKSFIKAVDEMSPDAHLRICSGLCREMSFLADAEEHATEVIENLKIVNEDFVASVKQDLLPESEEPAEICPVCTEGWGGSCKSVWTEPTGQIPEQWRAIKMPCCGKHMHSGCVQGALCKPPESRVAPTCPMCRTNMYTKHGWFANPARPGREVVRSQAFEAYMDTGGFFPHDNVERDGSTPDEQASQSAGDRGSGSSDEMDVDEAAEGDEMTELVEADETDVDEEEEMVDSDEEMENADVEQEEEEAAHVPPPNDSDADLYDENTDDEL